MRQIKFRGRVPDDDKPDGGKIVYGYLVVYDSGKYTHWLIRPNEDRNVPVVPSSVEQLIGIDKYGTEVYEGDRVIRIFDYDDNGNRIKVSNWGMNATFEDFAAIRDGDIILIKRLTLAEEAN